MYMLHSFIYQQKISDLNIAILTTNKNVGILPINNNELQFLEILHKVFWFFIGKL